MSLLDTVENLFKTVIDVAADMKVLREKVAELKEEVVDNRKRIDRLEATNELHFEKLKVAFLEARAQLQLPPSDSNG